MLIAIRDHGIKLPTSLRQWAIDRVTRAFAVVRGRVRKVMVYLTDVNGPRGGVDKRCRVAVTMDDGRSLVVHESGESVTAVVDGAAGRAGHAVYQEIDRRNDRRRTGRLVRALKRLNRMFGRDGGRS